MKKIFLIIVIVLGWQTAISQPAIVPTSPYANNFLLPISCDSVHPNFDTINNLSSLISAHYYSAVAQPYIIDSIIAIRGIAGLVHIIHTMSYLQGLCDSTMETFQLRKQINNDFPVNSLIYGTVPPINPSFPNLLVSQAYLALFFDHPIFIRDTFYTVMNMPAYGSELTCSDNYIYDSRDTRTLKTDCCEHPEILVKARNNTNPNDWIYFTQDTFSTYNQSPSSPFYFMNSVYSWCAPSLYLFPILDTTPIFSRATTTITDDTTNGTFAFVIDIDTSNCLTLPSEVGFIYSTDTTGGLTLENPLVSVINYPYDTTTNSFTDYKTIITFHATHQFITEPF
ncbi:MAG: hypothetical protein LBR17_05235 [Bacteroidales bacterium]|jgi:hypothetical protein|nr:hypothetical protein [Bacteroidales bacterium]